MALPLCRFVRLGAVLGAGRLRYSHFGALLTMLMAFQLMRQNRVWPRLLFAATLFSAIVLSGMSACGPNQHVTPVGMYKTEIQVVAGTFTATVPMNVTVTK